MKTPKKTNLDLAEEIGIHIGDGSMNKYRNTCLYSLRGHRYDDYKYYTKFIPNFYKRIYGIKVHIRKWPDVIGFQFGSKDLVMFKHNVLGLPLGPKNSVSIPNFILKSKALSCRCLRGIFDTDGCLTFEKKSRKLPYYPRIIISTTSKKLNEQLVEILKNTMKFNLSTWSTTYNRRGWNDIHMVCIRGEKNINKWFKMIGSDNPKNI
ncbi:hypothetical protein EPN87_00650, partial [archaeon]